MPDDDFEAELAKPGRPTTEGVLSAGKTNGTPQMNPDALQAWGRIKDFERYGLLDHELKSLVKDMTEPMRTDVESLAPRICKWLFGNKS